MDGATIARVLHVLGVVLWIGGVAMVTTVLLPATQRLKTPAERIDCFSKPSSADSRCRHASPRCVTGAERTLSRLSASISGSASPTSSIGGCTRWCWCGRCSR